MLDVHVERTGERERIGHQHFRRRVVERIAERQTGNPVGRDKASRPSERRDGGADHALAGVKLDQRAGKGSLANRFHRVHEAVVRVEIILKDHGAVEFLVDDAPPQRVMAKVAADFRQGGGRSYWWALPSAS